MQSNELHSTKTLMPPLKKVPKIIVTFFFILFVLEFSSIYSSWKTSSLFTATITRKKQMMIVPKERRNKAPRIIQEYNLNCSVQNQTQTCPLESDYPTNFDSPDNNVTCPDYFRWIHEDLKPFQSTGISREMVDGGEIYSHFRLVILKGKVYVKRYKEAIQRRDLYTIWGILQLLRRYPGRLPDLELMFDCHDSPKMQKQWFEGSNATLLPAVFRYCTDQSTYGIIFPDWSFWGCALFNIRPWETVLKELEKANKRMKWTDRNPQAYWKGNYHTSPKRRDLLRCNVSEKDDWNARVFKHEWLHEIRNGFKHSNLSSKCSYRYNIYIEGYSWSTSAKYILACDSPTLLIRTRYDDFFLRSLQPLQHYWPINDNDTCRSIKFAVDWGNKNEQKAQEIGKTASNFVQKELKMEFIYDYAFHLLNEYAELLRFAPIVPEGAVELCSETMACYADGREKEMFFESLVKCPSISSPCTLPSPYDPQVLETMQNRKANTIELVENWERDFWEDPLSSIL